MKGIGITMGTLWVDLSDGKTQISGTQPTPASVPVHEITVREKKQTLVYRSTIPDFYLEIVRVLMAQQMQKAQVSDIQNFPDLLVLYFQKDKDRDRIAQMAMTCSYFTVSVEPNSLVIEYDINSKPIDIDQSVDVKDYDIEDLNKGGGGMTGPGGKPGPVGPPPVPQPPPEPKPDPDQFIKDNPPLTEGGEGEGTPGSGECSGEGGSGECSGEGDPLTDSPEGSGEGDGEGEPGDATTSEDGKPSPCEECSQEAKDQNDSLDPATDPPEDAMEKAKAATDAALEAEKEADPQSESDKKLVDEAKEAAKEAIDKAREVNKKDLMLDGEEYGENKEALDDMEDSLTSDFEKLAEELQDELDNEDGEISNQSSMDLVRKLIKLKSLATPHDREEVERIENEIKTKIESE